jgi:serine/threonine protein kinase
MLHYRLLEKLGSGSMGEVWKAEDTELRRTVALKVLPEFLTGQSQAIDGLRQEARHAPALNHPNICTIHGIEECGGRWFLVMEYIDGHPFRRNSRRRHSLLAGSGTQEFKLRRLWRLPTRME